MPSDHLQEIVVLCLTGLVGILIILAATGGFGLDFSSDSRTDSSLEVETESEFSSFESDEVVRDDEKDEEIPTTSEGIDDTESTEDFSESISSITGNVILTHSLVSQHNVPGDCWLILDNVVYDATSLIGTSQEGDEIIINRCGGDATQALYSSHPIYRIRLVSYRIGSLGEPYRG